MAKVMMGFPHGLWQPVWAATAQRNALIELAKAGGLWGCCDVGTYRTDHNRNSIVDQFLNAPPDVQWLAMLDDDIVTGELSLVTQWRRAEMVNADVYSAVTFQGNGLPNVFSQFVGRKPFEYGSILPIFERAEPQMEAFLTKYELWGYEPPLVLDVGIENSVIPIEGCGTSGIFIHRRLLERIKPPWFDFQCGGSEDLYFCDRAIHDGKARMVADLGIIHGHCRNRTVGPQDFRVKRQDKAPVVATPVLNGQKEGV